MISGTGWFSKPEEKSDDTESPEDMEIIQDFASRVKSESLSYELERLSGTIRYATSKGDYEYADYIRNG